MKSLKDTVKKQERRIKQLEDKVAEMEKEDEPEEEFLDDDDEEDGDDHNTNEDNGSAELV